jgi:hypothetical protein
VAVFLAGSAGGATTNSLTIGALQAPASEAVIELDRATGTALRYQEIRFDPDGTVTIGLPAPFVPGP